MFVCNGFDPLSKMMHKWCFVCTCSNGYDMYCSWDDYNPYDMYLDVLD